MLNMNDITKHWPDGGKINRKRQKKKEKDNISYRLCTEKSNCLKLHSCSVKRCQTRSPLIRSHCKIKVSWSVPHVNVCNVTRSPRDCSPMEHLWYCSAHPASLQQCDPLPACRNITRPLCFHFFTTVIEV